MDKNITRLLSKINDTGACWEWIPPLSRDGYGYFYHEGKVKQAHRASYELLVGPIPSGLHIDHLCRNRKCVNPEHLEPVTQRENNLRTVAHKTHCPAGHDYVTYGKMWGKKRNTRYCSECNKIKTRNRRERLKQAETSGDVCQG